MTTLAQLADPAVQERGRWTANLQDVRRLLVPALLLLGLAVAPLAPAAPADGAPPCRPGGPPVVLEGTVAPEQAKTYLLLPFAVADGTTRVEVGYRWGDADPRYGTVPFSGTVLDLGLWDADGTEGPDAFRGWSGSRQGVLSRGMAPVWVQADAAERGYLPGPVEVGTWHVELGAAVVSPGGGTYHVEIRCLDVSVGPAPVPDPVDAQHVARAEPGWYHGDFHMHAYHSSPSGPGAEAVVAHAREVGLDFLPITEYVTTAHHATWGPVQRANPDLVIWPGREIITYAGHANALGETPSVVEYRHGHDGATLRDIQERTLADGALFQINHPTIFPGPVLSNACRGCEFELRDVVDLDRVDTIEVLTGPIEVDGSEVGLPAAPASIEQPFVQTAIDLWEDLLVEGHRVTAVSGSDEKSVGGHGSSATAVYAEALSRPALIEAIRAGRAYVRTRGVAESPTLEMTASADGTTVGLGGTLYAATATMDVRVRGGDGQLLDVTRNGTVVATVPVVGDDWSTALPAVRGLDGGPLGTFYRVDVRTAVSRSLIANPIFLR